MGRKALGVLAGALALAAGLALPAHAVTLWHFVGTVTDGVGRPLAGAAVYDGGQSTLTDSQGRYSLGEQSTGSYTLTASRADTVQDSQDINVIVPQDTTVNFVLGYLVSASIAHEWVSTAAGPVSDAVTARSWAPSGSCLSVHDTRTGATTPASLVGSNGDGTSTFAWTLLLPQAAPEGIWFLDAIAEDCATLKPLSPDWGGRTGYVVDNSAPSVSVASPAPVTNAAPTIQATVTDRCGSGVQSIAVTLDSAPVPLAYRWFTDSSGCLGAVVSYQAEGLPPRPHAAAITVADYAGNVASETVPFTVDTTPPILSTPTPTGTINTRTPTISVMASDPDHNLAPSTITMTLSNGVVTSTLAPSYDPATGTISYHVPTIPTGAALGQFPLLDGNYTVAVAVSDSVGNTARSQWSFAVATLP